MPNESHVKVGTVLSSLFKVLTYKHLGTSVSYGRFFIPDWMSIRMGSATMT